MRLMRLQLPARVRRVAARRPWTVWVVAAVLAVAVASSVHGALQALDEQREAWGATRSVWVARVDHQAGDAVAGTLARRAVPEAMIPVDALATSRSLSAATVARQRIGAGEVVTVHDVTAPDGDEPLAPRGWVTVAVREPIPTGASVGRSVTVAADGAVLAADATVVGTHDDVVLVAVPADDGPAVAAAAIESRATLLVDE